MSEETQELKVQMNNPNLKDVVYQYIKTCDGQLNLKECASDLQISYEDALNAVTLLELEGKIRVNNAKSPPTEATPVDTETKETIVITLITLSEEEAIQPSIESTAETVPEGTTAEKPTDVFAEEIIAETEPEEIPKKTRHRTLAIG